MKACFSLCVVFVCITSVSTGYARYQSNASRKANSLEAARSIAQDGYWIYVGRYSPDKKVWLNKNFDIDAVPEAGASITSLLAITKRKDFPVKDNNYKISSSVGVLKSGETVKISEVKALVGNNYWVKVDR